MQFESNSHDEVQEELKEEDNQIVLPQSNDFYVIFSFARNVDLAIDGFTIKLIFLER